MGPSWKERTLIPIFMYGIEKISVHARDSTHWSKTPNKH
jgi:hypothetical protein